MQNRKRVAQDMNPMVNGMPAAQGMPGAFTAGSFAPGSHKKTQRGRRHGQRRTLSELRREEATAAPEAGVEWSRDRISQKQDMGFPTEQEIQEISRQAHWPVDKVKVWTAHAVLEWTAEIQDAHKAAREAGKLPRDRRPEASVQLEQLFSLSAQDPEDNTWEEFVSAITTRLTVWNLFLPE